MNKYLFLMGLVVSPLAMAEEQNKQSWLDFIVEVAKDIPDFIEENEIPVPVYGNYCGPHHGDGTYSQAPIDAVDEACMRHDQCYDPKVGGTRLSCECDFAFVNELSKYLWKAEKKSKYTTAFVTAAIGYFSLSKCECKDRLGKTRLVSKMDFEQLGQCHS